MGHDRRGLMNRWNNALVFAEEFLDLGGNLVEPVETREIPGDGENRELGKHILHALSSKPGGKSDSLLVIVKFSPPFITQKSPMPPFSLSNIEPRK